MKNKKNWNINKSINFNEIEKIELTLDIKNHGLSIAKVNNNETFKCKKLTSWTFVFKRYPFMFVPTIVLTFVYMYLYPFSFLFYILFTLVLFTLAIRHCFIPLMGNVIMVFWLLHLVLNFFVIGGGTLSSFAIESYNRLYYVQGLFFGMMLTHLWIYLLIFRAQYYEIYNVLEKKDEYDDYSTTPWYIWRGCPLCNKKFNLFLSNCKEN